MKLETVYLKKQVYNYAHWITGSGWWGKGDVDEGTLGVIQAWGPLRPTTPPSAFCLQQEG